ncbi:amidohydrolase family protein [Paraburkholderia sp. 22099]|jgi:cytosine/adenosine deaminase-related metal-dependent hydrolase|uniref:amidohydrolase family protein n=1 Tax=Paraburkholderia TaxID=1822464 RepID=UPI00285AB59E|nr:amidohydrolase family protein [Paraburkholderia terricola]MDR6496461.1 cytosine/adenosine deaminase-related metal-dependent hydrolase [Paraburkholderia terricola]
MTSFIVTPIAYGLTGKTGIESRFNGALRVENGVITAIGDLQAREGERIVDATGCVVCPGFVNTHHHLFQSIMKSVPSAMNAGLDKWVMDVPYTFWPKIDEHAMTVSATIGIAELVLSGATTIADQHYIFSDRYDFDPAQVLFDTAGKFGARFVLGRGGLTHGRPWHSADMPPPPTDTLDQMIAGLESAKNRWHDPSPMSMRRVAAAPVTTVFNMREGEVRELARATRQLGLRMHTHLSENDTYVRSTMERFGKRPVHWMADQEWLGPDVWFAHLVKCDRSEIELLAETGTAMAHCPQSNARLGSGIAPAPAMHDAGGIISLAVDGTAANEAGDMAQAIYSAFTVHRATGRADATQAETVMNWATQGGARALGFEGIGTLEVGKAADLVLLDLDQPRYFGQHDPTIAPIVSGGQFSVRHSFANGRELVVNGQVPWLDMRQLRQDAEQVVTKLLTS